MKPFVAVIGLPNSGKSAVIKSLTGCQNNTFRGFVEDFTTGQRIYVCASSPQENELSEKDLIDLLNKASKDTKCLGVVMAIQPNNPRKRLNMQTILDKAISNGYAIHAFVIDPGRNGSHVPSQVMLSLPKAVSINGRRFALYNALEIRERTQLL